jgi:uroporphyrinogen III methyltransferase / synthase
MDNNYGKVFLVGAGPGAADLITLKGVQCLERAEVVLYDELASGGLLERVPSGAERIYVGKHGSHKAMSQEAISQLLVERARAGKRVVRLKGGDPFVFGRGGEEAAALAEAGLAFEVVPGVTSAVAVPMYAGIPVTHRGMAESFEVLTGHGGELPSGPQTAVVLMGVRRLADNVARLLERPGFTPQTPAAVIQWGTLARQRTVSGTLETIVERAAGLDPPAVLVAGPTVALRQQLSWFEHRPLFGLRVLVTRARHQAGETCRLLEELGAQAVTLPTIEICPAEGAALRLRTALLGLANDDLLILTSANAVTPLREGLEALSLDSRALAGVTLCAIGPGTARALAGLGLRADLIPDDHRAEGLLDLLPAARVSGKRVLLPRAAKAREILPRTLEQRGAQVDLIPVYETVLPQPEVTEVGLARLEAGEIDVLTFTSASTAENFAELVGDALPQRCAGKTIVAIGPITRDACLAAGMNVDVMPQQTYTLPAMVEALVEHHLHRNDSTLKGEDNDAVP